MDSPSALVPGPIARTLLELAERGASGEIAIGGRKLVLHEGQVIGVLPAPGDEPLDTFLVKAGRLDDAGAEFVDALQLAQFINDALRRIRVELETAAGIKTAVVVTDSFGRAWRQGQSEVAIGCAGINPLEDLRVPAHHRLELREREPAVAVGVRRRRRRAP